MRASHSTHSGWTARIPAAPAGPTERMLQRPRRWREQGAQGEGQIAHLEALRVQKCSRIRLRTLHGARPLPGARASRRRAGDRGPLLRTSKWSVAGTRASGTGAAAAGDLRGQRASRRGCPAPGRGRRAGAGLWVRGPPPEKRASPPRAAPPPPESAGSRLSRPRPAVFSPGPAPPRGGCLCSAHKPASSRRAGGRQARAPGARILLGGSAVRLKSQ